jgi:hypothetical protein
LIEKRSYPDGIQIPVEPRVPFILNSEELREFSGESVDKHLDPKNETEMGQYKEAMPT